MSSVRSMVPHRQQALPSDTQHSKKTNRLQGHLDWLNGTSATALYLHTHTHTFVFIYEQRCADDGYP